VPDTPASTPEVSRTSAGTGCRRSAAGQHESAANPNQPVDGGVRLPRHAGLADVAGVGEPLRREDRADEQHRADRRAERGEGRQGTAGRGTGGTGRGR
jgi:hypothetical protein